MKGVEMALNFIWLCPKDQILYTTDLDIKKNMKLGPTKSNSEISKEFYSNDFDNKIISYSVHSNNPREITLSRMFSTDEKIFDFFQTQSSRGDEISHPRCAGVVVTRDFFQNMSATDNSFLKYGLSKFPYLPLIELKIEGDEPFAIPTSEGAGLDSIFDGKLDVLQSFDDGTSGLFLSLNSTVGVYGNQNNPNPSANSAFVLDADEPTTPIPIVCLKELLFSPLELFSYSSRGQVSLFFGKGTIISSQILDQLDQSGVSELLFKTSDLDTRKHNIQSVFSKNRAIKEEKPKFIINESDQRVSDPLNVANSLLVSLCQIGIPIPSIKKSLSNLAQIQSEIKNDKWLKVPKIKQFLDEKTTIQHASITTVLFNLFLEKLGFRDNEIMRAASVGSFFHDVALSNKAGFSELTLMGAYKRKPFNEGNEVIKEFLNHPVEGAKIIQSVGEESILTWDLIANHHERRTGAGFPRGLGSNALNLVTDIMGYSETLGNLFTMKSQIDSIRFKVLWDGLLTNDFRSETLNIADQIGITRIRNM